MAVIIYGHQATGKTLHSERFRTHYQCARVVELDEVRDANFKPHRYDLLLTTCSRDKLVARFPGSRIVSINAARRAVGLEPAPDRGFFAKSAPLPATASVTGWDHRYRQLGLGELILPTDECRKDDGSWVTGVCVGTPAPDPAYTAHRVYRRLKVEAAPIGRWARLRRHIIPRFEAGGWTGAALTQRPGGGAELPPGIARACAIALGKPTTTPVRDDVDGGILCVQWLGLMIEIGVGRVR